MSAKSAGTRCVNRELCGEGFRDMRGLINCKGCGLKFRSGAEFGTHAKKGDERKRNRQEMAEQMMMKGRQEENCDNTNRGDSTIQGEGKPGAVKQNSETTRTHVRMPGQAAVGMPGLATTNKAGPGSNISELSSSDKMPPDQMNITSGPGHRKTDISGPTASSTLVPRPQPTDMPGHTTASVSRNSQTHAAASGPEHRPASMPEYLVQEVGNKGNIGPHTISITPFSTNLPAVLPTQHPVVTQQILQQQQQIALQQEQQQQLIILRQQLQQQQQQHPPISQYCNHKPLPFQAFHPSSSSLVTGTDR